MSVCVRGRALSVVLAYRPETASRTGCVQASVLLGVDSVRIGVLLGAVARVAYRWVARGGWSMHADGASARIFHRCAPPCARSPAWSALRCVRRLTAAIRLRAVSLPIGVQLSAGNLVRPRAEELVLLGPTALLTGVVLDAAAQGRYGPQVLLGAKPARCVLVARCARCVSPFGARRQCTASDGRGPRWMRPAGRSSPGRRPRRLPGRGPAAVGRSYPRRTNSARQTGLRFAGLIRVIERAVELAAALSLPVARQVRTTSFPSTRRLMASMISFVESLGVGLVDLVSRPGRGTPWWRRGPAGRTASASGQRPSGLGSARGLSPPPQLPGRVALAEQVVGRCYGRADPAGDALNVYRPAPGRRRRACPGSARRHPARRVARQVKPGRFARTTRPPPCADSSAASRLIDGYTREPRVHHQHARINAICRRVARLLREGLA